MQKASAYAPGRVELLGNHTDYNEGYVLSAAIDRGVSMKGAMSADDAIHLHGIDHNLTLRVPGKAIARNESETWANYLLGVVWSLRQEGFEIGGFDAEFSSTLPMGAGLSSSAALEVATANLLCKLFSLKIEPMRLAKICRRAENEFVGVNCGLLDQVSSVFGKAHHAIFLDCRNETVMNIPFPNGVELLITHSGVKHALVGGEYNERRAQCFEAARILGVKALRDVTSAQLEAARCELPQLDYKRALHVVGENERVTRGAHLLNHRDVKAFGALMFASHESSRLNFENSTPELDALVEIAREEPGVLGSRLTGGGFGGATVSLIEESAAAAISANISRKYHERTGNNCQTYICQISDGAC
jgi:galactokinase